ncbi:hypothetical protein L6452_05143 [Arctium lappa]|uniref:Uncharacterized protein n=1 Tax=Arctium lappa TaxID=4217 RepID=A0ACB9EGN6_ARCLA|nr:hypothetical protein L6452_05143 [Arctium lappa]
MRFNIRIGIPHSEKWYSIWRWSGLEKWERKGLAGRGSQSESSGVVATGKDEQLVVEGAKREDGWWWLYFWWVVAAGEDEQWVSRGAKGQGESGVG